MVRRADVTAKSHLPVPDADRRHLSTSPVSPAPPAIAEAGRSAPRAPSSRARDGFPGADRGQSCCGRWQEFIGVTIHRARAKIVGAIPTGDSCAIAVVRARVCSAHARAKSPTNVIEPSPGKSSASALSARLCAKNLPTISTNPKSGLSRTTSHKARRYAGSFAARFSSVWQPRQSVSGEWVIEGNS